ncbi:MAG: zinc-binding dehydrogenase [Actinomycetota bacterium]
MDSGYLQTDMRAAVLHQYATTPVVGDFDDPEEAAQGQVVLEVVAAGMNPVDRSIASGSFYAGSPTLPYVVGREGVARLGDGRLAYFNSAVAPFGAFGQRVLVEQDSLVALPEGIEPAQAIACGIAGSAAWLALTRRAQTREGETVLVLGAGGVVGQVAIQAARLLGAGRVVAAARSEQGLELAARLGADACVVIGSDRWQEALIEAAAGPGYDVVIDPLWGEPAAAAVEAMAFGGRLVQIGQSAGPTALLGSGTIRGRMLTIIGHTNLAADSGLLREAYNEIAAHSARGDLTVAVKRASLDELPAIWEAQANSPGHKLIVDF